MRESLRLMNIRWFVIASGLLLLSSSEGLLAASFTDEEAVGHEAAARILGVAPLYGSSEAQRYINLVGSSIADLLQAPYRWRFALIDSGSINAFATPGGYVLVTRGLVRLLESEDELAFVLAHEISHVLRKHHYKVIQRQRLAEKASQGLQATMGGSTLRELSQASAQIYARGLDKEAEFEADRMGGEWLAKAGYDLTASLGVLEKLQAFKGDESTVALLFSTHPSPADRMDALLAAGLGNVTTVATARSGARERFSAFKRLL